MPEASVRTAFLGALSRLHQRFLVDVEGVSEVWLVRHGDAYGELGTADELAVRPGGGDDEFFGQPRADMPPADAAEPPRIDPPLSPRGRHQATLLGQRLAASKVDAVWSSALLRAQETASLAAAPGGLRTDIDDRLREVRTHWDNTDTSDLDTPDTPYIPFVEPLEEVVERMDAAVRALAVEAGPGGRVAAVSHAGAISMYLAHLLRLDSGPLRLLPRFTSISVVLVKDDLVVVQSIGDVGHLLRESVE
ncbi:MAG: histidine phosphatase family protein [Candidatus Dormibacteraeota bacterium]|nr:histidine phosphatase family protein [Candidatus Dormibacteraeota bacterium]